jgi:hypothetical protein
MPKRKTKPKTESCEQVWKLIIQLRRKGRDTDHLSELELVKLADKLANAFCTFECAWQTHSDEWHGEHATANPKSATNYYSGRR